MSLPLFPLGVFAAAAAVVYLVTHPWRKPTSPLPPGPPGDPIIGNLRQMPSTKAAHVFHEWAKTYGDVICLKTPGRTIIVLDSLQAAEDLLEKRSLNYSNRPEFHLYKLFGWTSFVTTQEYGKKLNTLRQMHQSYLSRQKVIEHKPMQIQEARTLVKNLLTGDPDMYKSFLSRFTTGIITQIIAGHKIESGDDRYLRRAKMVTESFNCAGPPAGTAIDFFPFLQHFPRWFPGTYYLGVADQWRAEIKELYEFPIQTVKKQKEAGVARPSFLLTHLDAMEGGESVTEEDMEILKGAATSMFAAGEDAIWSSLSFFILAMILHPECQVKAQKEIESVVGTSRLPEFSDRESLPYVECIYQEVFRWHPGLPLGVPHRCIEDDNYRGMLIPAGAIVFSNIRGMTLDENIYSNPTAFLPERYLPKPVGNAEPHFSGKFGFGRRVCTGKYLAENSLWIAIVTMLASCTLNKPIDQDGNIITPEVVMSHGLASHPLEIPCIIKPRTLRSEGIIVEALACGN
ncbi:cytochrome P450 [Mycena epipterygia]|nr:cytochrome P450 [Mycena epipterygia]